MGGAIQSYRDLKVWQIGMLVARDVYTLARQFPKHEEYGLSSQMRRAAVSVPSNIAEGHARDSTKEYLRHLSIAFGSCAELETQLILSHQLNYLTSEQMEKTLQELQQLGRMLRSLQTSLKRKLRTPKP